MNFVGSCPTCCFFLKCNTTDFFFFFYKECLLWGRKATLNIKYKTFTIICIWSEKNGTEIWKHYADMVQTSWEFSQQEVGLLTVNGGQSSKNKAEFVLNRSFTVNYYMLKKTNGLKVYRHGLIISSMF